MPIVRIPYEIMDTNAYLVHNDQDAVIIDPPLPMQPVLQMLEQKGLSLAAILVTHLHFDHVGGCDEWCGQFNLPASVGRQEVENKQLLAEMNRRFSFPDILDYPYQILDEGPARFGSLECQVLLTPGHSPGSLSFYFPTEQAVCCGDVLFKGSVGRSDFPGGDFARLCQSLREKIYVLPPNTLVCPGHGPETTVGEEAAHNPFCRAED